MQAVSRKNNPGFGNHMGWVFLYGLGEGIDHVLVAFLGGS